MRYKNSKYSKMQKGGKQPIVVTNPNDPRLKAYNDSLQVYNAMTIQNKLMGDEFKDKPDYPKKGYIDTVNKPDYSTDKLNKLKQYQKEGKMSGIYNNYNEMMNSTTPSKNKQLIKEYRKLGIPDKNISFYNSPDLIDTKVKPVATYFDGAAYSPYYKKPVQPVVYQKPQPISKRATSEYWDDGKGNIWQDKYKEAKDYKKRPVVKIAPVEQPEKIFPAPVAGQSRPARITTPQQSMMPEPQGDYIYGPANSVIGTNVNGKFTPINMPEQRGKVNQADWDMLKNQESMKKYVQQKGLRFLRGGKKQTGGQYRLDGSWSPGYLDKKTGAWVSTGENVPPKTTVVAAPATVAAAPAVKIPMAPVTPAIPNTNPLGESPWLAKGQPNPLVPKPVTPVQIPMAPEADTPGEYHGRNTPGGQEYWDGRPDDAPGKLETDASSGRTEQKSVIETTTKAPHNWNTDIFFGLRGAQMAASFLAQKTRNNRMNEYDYKQQTALGQMNPMPVSQFQYSNNDYTTPNRMYAQQGGSMNPYLYHSKYGGNLKTILREHGKWSNDAGPMDMTDGTEPRYPERKKGGFALDEMVVRDFMSKLMQFGRGPHPYGGMRKAQQGGATRADSIAVLNSQLAQNNYYKSKPFKEEVIPGDPYYFSQRVMNEVTDGSLATIRRDYSGYKDFKTINPYEEYIPYGKTKEQVENSMRAQLVALKSNKRDGNKYLYSDLVTPLLDYTAPMSLVDLRIKPQGIISRGPKNKEDRVPGNAVDTFYYDTLAVTPWDMLTPAQREKRIKKYGTSGTPIKGNPVQAPTMNRAVPVESERIFSSPRPAKSRPAKITSPNQVVDRIVPQPEAAQRPMSSDSIPVYGPANSTIGYNDNGKFVPYEGVNQRGTVNNPDSELVNNPEALKQYLRGKGFKKKGGLTANKAREILHDNSAQGHPLTDKQRRFFGAMSKGHTNYRGK